MVNVMTTLPLPRVPTVLTGALALALLLAASAAPAQSRTARLSEDLARQVATADPAPVRVILTGSPEEVDTLVARHGLRLRRRLATGAAVDVPPGQLSALAGDAAVTVLSSDQIVRSHMAVTNTTIGADIVQAGLAGVAPLSGRGIGVAVLDSGVTDVPELHGRIAASVDFTETGGNGQDKFGHGTHIAGIIAAAGAARQPELTGVAPGAHIVNVKVLDSTGAGRASDVIAGIDWVIANRFRYNIRVINLSLGAPVLQPWRDDPLCQAVQRAYAAGIIVVAAAGNAGKTSDGRPIVGGVSSPGNSPHAITVGALNTKGTPWRSDDEVASYSSRGPTRFDGLIKPDLVAPGNRIRGVVAPGARLTREHPELVVGTGRARTLELSGTSMSAAVVSGAVALLVEKNGPGFTTTGVKLALQ